MLSVTPLYGSRWESSGEARKGSCTLVEYADVKVLVDVGLKDEDCDSFWKNLPSHDCLVLTDSTLESMGSLPLYVQAYEGKTTEMPPIFATFPTVKMGQMTLYDYHANLSLDGGRPPYTLEQMDGAIAQLQTIKYSQTLTLRSKTGTTKQTTTNAVPKLSITAHRAGHVVGGAFYRLENLLDETSVVVTGNSYQIARELHLDACTLLKNGTGADVLVTRPGGPAFPLVNALFSKRMTMASKARKDLSEKILGFLRRDANVLLPVDASGRALELVLLLNRFWAQQNLGETYNLVWFGSMVRNTLEFGRSQLEWMNAQLGNNIFDLSYSRTNTEKGKHPYLLKHVTLCTNMTELEKVLSNDNPTCVLANGLTLDHGPSRDLFLKWADNDNNAVIFTDSSQCWKRKKEGHSQSANLSEMTSQADTPDDEHNGEDSMMGRPLKDQEASPFTVAYQLLKHWALATAEDREMDDVVEVDVKIPRRTPLVGTELSAFLEKEEASMLAKRKQEEEEAMLQEVELAKGRLRLGEDAAAKEPKAKAKAAHLPFFRKKKSRFDSSLFLKFSKPLHLTFELREDPFGIGQKDLKSRFGIGMDSKSGDVLEDDYGISVFPEQFRDIVTGVDPSKFGAQKDEINKRGLGYASSSTSTTISVSHKRRRRNEMDVKDDDDERGMEAIDLSEGTGIIRGRNGRPPTKVSTVHRRIEVMAEIDYIPLEGRVDARGARQSVRALQPRQVIVLGGGSNDQDSEVQALASAAQIGRKDPVETPSDAERIELQVGHNAYPARLVSTPFRTKEERLKEETIPDPIELVETKIGGCTVSRLDFVMTGQKVALDGSIVIAPKKDSQSKQEASPKSIFEKELEEPPVYVSDGEVLLTDLRTELIAQHGMKAEYSAHAEGYSRLVVNGRVVVKKWSEDHPQKAGKIDVEGPLCEDFFTVRSVVCGQYVTL